MRGRTIAIFVGLCLGLLNVGMITLDAEGAVIPSGTWTGIPTDPYSCDMNPYLMTTDFHIPTGFGSYDLGNRSVCEWVQDPIYHDTVGLYWIEEENGHWFDAGTPGYLYWNSPDAETGEWGTATTRFELSNPAIHSDYYELEYHVRALIFDGDDEGASITGLYDFDFAQDDDHSCRVELYYTASDGTFVSAKWPEAGYYAQMQDPVDGTSIAPWGLNIGGNGINYDQGTVDEQFSKQGGQTIIPQNGTYYHEDETTFHLFETNPYTGIPWSYAEVCALRGAVHLSWYDTIFDYAEPLDEDCLVLALRQAYVVAIPVDYEPEEIPDGSFILRPDGDLEDIDEWYNASSMDQTDLWNCVNEDDFMSDHNDSMISLDESWPLNWVGFTMSDPPWWAADVEYQITLWVILESSDDTWSTFEDYIFELFIDPYGSAYPPDRYRAYSMYSFWFNYSVTSYGPSETFLENPENWTLDSLTGFTIAFVSWISGAYTNISQMAVLCIPLTDVVIPDGGDEEPADTDFIAWLSSGSSIVGLFGIVGFIGLVATPAIMAYNIREGNDTGFSGMVKAGIAMTLFLGMLMVGIYAGG